MKPLTIAILAGAAVVAAVYFAKKTGDAVKAVGAAIDPTSSDNIAYSAVNKVGAVVTGDPNFSLGSAVYNATHKDVGMMPVTPAPIVTKGQLNKGVNRDLIR